MAAKKKTEKEETVKKEKKKSASFSSKQLRRSEDDRIIAGISGGLGKYFDIDATFIRLIFILLTVFGGGGILLYIVLWLIMPSENSATKSPEEALQENTDEIKQKAEQLADNVRYKKVDRGSKRNNFAYILIIIGIAFLLNNMGFLDFVDVSRFWPLILVFLGLIILFDND